MALPPTLSRLTANRFVVLHAGLPVSLPLTLKKNTPLGPGRFQTAVTVPMAVLQQAEAMFTNPSAPINTINDKKILHIFILNLLSLVHRHAYVEGRSNA